MKITKFSVFVAFLLLIVFCEGLIVIYDILHPLHNSFSLDKQEYSVPERKIDVQPLIFETSEISEFMASIEDLREKAKDSLINKVISLSQNSQVINSEISADEQNNSARFL